MPYRIVNLSNPPLVISHGTPQAQPLSVSVPLTKISQMIDALKGKKGTVVVPSGIYQENVVVPDGVSLMGNGLVKINGNLTANGEGLISFVDVDTFETNGKRLISNCVASVLLVSPQAFADCRNCQLTRISCTQGQFSVTNSTIGKPLADYTISLKGGIGLVETSTIEGESLVGSNSVLDCKHTSVIGEDDLFETEDETSTVQLFSCVVYGSNLIKSGPGTSIRFNVSALSDAVGFEGGENVKIESI